MKAKINVIKADTFKPFQLVIDVESVDEARSLWHRFNLSFANTSRYVPFDNHDCGWGRDDNIPVTAAWNELDDYMDDHNLK